MKKYFRILIIGVFFTLVTFNMTTAMEPTTTDTTIEHYGIDQKFKTVEYGKIKKEEALEITEQFVNQQIGLKGDAGYVISKSIFGFSYDESSFIEISLDNEKKYRVKLEFPYKSKTLFLNTTKLYQKEIIITGKEHLRELVSAFFDLDLKSFKSHFEGIK